MPSLSLPFLGKKGNTLGLDFGSDSIAAAELTPPGPSAPTLLRAAVNPLAEGLIFDGEVVDIPGLSSAVRQFFTTNGFGTKGIRLGIANQKIVVRTLEFPFIENPDELRTAVEFEAQDHIPIPIDEAVLDFQPLSRFTDATGADKQRLLLVAAQRDMVDRFAQAFRGAGVSLGSIDVQAFALIRSVVPAVANIDEGSPDLPALAIVNVGSTMTDLLVAVGGNPQFYRIIPVGSDEFVGAICDLKSEEREAAKEMVWSIGLPGAGHSVSETYDEQTVSQVNQILSGAAEPLADEIRRSIDYFHSQSSTGSVEQLILTGNGGMVPGFGHYLSQRFAFTVSLGDPRISLAGNRSNLSEEVIDRVGPRLAISIGLAMGEV